ncbi:MAG TPA: alpha-amylase family glycosyl hydrolase [Prolixibacteraceae bacterium]|nr:alpha-amylase family glycosyl hydrolase [Prolixibacteraceae bacterium]
MRKRGKNKLHVGVIIFATAIIILFTVQCDKSEPEGSIKPPVTVEKEIPFDKTPKWSEMVVYEVNPLVFGPDGTFSNITERLSDIKDLGVNVLWLMPIFPEGQLNGVGSPYAVQNYTEVAPSLGNITDLKQLVKEAHKLEMAVIIDWVANHTAWDNPWIENDSWYTKDSQGNIINPPGTNWQDVAELNYNNEEMRNEMIKSMKFWVETCNIDGFRCDAVDFVPFDFWKQAIDSLQTMEGRSLIFLAESGKKESLTAGFQFNYSWDFQSKLVSIFKNKTAANQLATTHMAEMSQVPEGRNKLRYITNHDMYAWEGSPYEQFGNNEAALAAFAATVFSGGIPLIYSGQETGYQEKISFFEFNPIEWDNTPTITSEIKQIIKIRKENQDFINTSFTSYSTSDIISFLHKKSNSELLVLINTRGGNASFTFPTELQNKQWTNLINNTNTEYSTKTEMMPYQYIILKR